MPLPGIEHQAPQSAHSASVVVPLGAVKRSLKGGARLRTAPMYSLPRVVVELMLRLTSTGTRCPSVVM